MPRRAALIRIKRPAGAMKTLAAMLVCRRQFAIGVCFAAFAGVPAKLVGAVAPMTGATALSAEFAQAVAPRVAPAAADVASYARRLDAALVAAGAPVATRTTNRR